jgi:hypothetical protein
LLGFQLHRVIFIHYACCSGRLINDCHDKLIVGLIIHGWRLTGIHVAPITVSTVAPQHCGVRSRGTTTGRKLHPKQSSSALSKNWDLSRKLAAPTFIGHEHRNFRPMKRRTIDEACSFARAVAEEIQRSEANANVETHGTRVSVIIESFTETRVFAPDPEMIYEDDPVEVAAAMLGQAYGKAFIAAVQDKQDRFAQAMYRWTQSHLREKTEQATVQAIQKSLDLYPQLEVPADRADYINDVKEEVLSGVVQALSVLVALLNHAVVTERPDDFDYMCAEVRHEVTSHLIRELVRDLEQTMAEARLPGIRRPCSRPQP